MVIFITTLGHPQCYDNFKKVETLFEITLRSVFAQTDPRFKFVVVCNQIPDIKFNDPRLIYHVVDFPPSSVGPTTIERYLSDESRRRLFLRDKGTKKMSGFLFAQQFAPDYIFYIDADDWVNTKVVEYLHREPSYPVWHVDGGYFVNYRTRRIKRKYGMTRYCGGTFVYTPAFLMGVANIKCDVDSHTGQDRLVSATSERFIYDILGDHPINYRYFAEMGSYPKPIPIRAIAYVLGTGENVSGVPGGQYGLPMNKRFCSEFGLSESFNSDEKATLTLLVHEFLGCFRSRVGWLTNRVTGANIYS
jgi:glycosyltransferase involved in cell wall biosynthesis